MKRLTRVRLINWHRFFNETITFDQSALLSGENGAGKSTILDAIQFVITASKNHFNKAAHENGKRKLDGYVRCKTGRENRPYERTGFVTAHVALEFFEESKQKYFILGAVVDSAVPEKEPTTVWYHLEGLPLEDSMFFQGMTPRNIDNFKVVNKQNLKLVTKIQTDARKQFKNRFGRIDDKFFELIPKSLAFKPIDDIKDFVYSYVLDKKEVNIEELKENVRTYQELEKILQVIAIKLLRLEKINEKYKEVQTYLRREKVYEYYIARVNVVINESGIAHESNKIKQNELKMKELNEKQKVREQQRDSKDKQRTNLKVELEGSDEYRALQQIQEEIKRLKDKLERLVDEKKSLNIEVRNSLKKATVLTNYYKEIDQTKSIVSFLKLLNDYIACFERIEDCSDYATASYLVERLIQEKNARAEEIRKQLYELNDNLSKENEKKKDSKQIIERLEQKKLNYPTSVLRLLHAIKAEFQKLNRNIEPRILCELLQVTKQKWTNAIEGYLNTQRFYLLVEPDDFDWALSIYKRLKEREQLYGVGLINTAKLEVYDEVKEDSLAACVTSESIYAKQYINMVLGKVICCEKEEQLKLHEVAITPGCMKYQNHVVSAIAPKLYEVPFIGQEAYKVQLEQERQRLQEYEKNIIEYKQKIAILNNVKDCIATDYEQGIKYNVTKYAEYKYTVNTLEKAMIDEKTLKENATYIEKQIQLESIEEEIKKLVDEIRNCDMEIGSCGKTILISKESIQNYQSKIQELEQELKAAEQMIQDDLNHVAKDFEELLNQKDMYKLKEDYDKARARNHTMKESATVDLITKMNEYKSQHDFGAEASLQGYSSFSDEYDKLNNSEILKYQEQVVKAKKIAEEEFREQFLSKLQENIKKAHGEMKLLNKALENITFGSEKYKFEFSPSKKYSMYYEMIMDDFNLMEGNSIFSGIFNETHREVIEELFEKLTAEGENSTKVLEEFTDYRSYMDYDIKIDHGDGSFSYYSKVCEEKSGGETQTPFYVTVAASFLQLYSNSIGGESIGLILFDEAFNNMDDERIAGVLEFFKQLNLQIIVAAPPDKIQYIAPSIHNTLLVLKDNETSYVERYSYEGV